MLGTLLGFVMGFFGSMPLTGPIAIMVLRKAMLGHYTRAYSVTFGAAIAEGIYCAFAVFGFNSLVQSFPGIISVTRQVGGGLLILLGIMFLRAQASVHKSADEPQDMKTAGVKRYFVLGFTISALNPVLIVTWSAAVAMVYSIGGVTFSLTDRLLFPFAVTIGITVWFVILISILRKHKEKLGIKLTSVLIKTMSFFLIGGGIYLLLTSFNLI